MQPHSEIILATIPGAREDEQLEVALCQFTDGSRVELRQQTWGEGIGWFTQSTIHLEPSQVAGLKNSLGTSSAAARPAPRLPREFSRVAPAAWQPRVVHADSA